MKTLKVAISALAVSLAVGLPAEAGSLASVEQVQPGETAYEYARRIDACDGNRVLAAEFARGGRAVEVQCAPAGAILTSGMSGGLSPGGAAAIAGGVIVAIIAIASGGSSSSTPGTN